MGLFRFLVFAVVSTAFQTGALAQALFSCREQIATSSQTSITGRLEAPDQIAQLTYRHTDIAGREVLQKRPLLTGETGRAEAPFLGTRFAFHEANVGRYLLFEPGLTEELLASDAPVQFGLAEVFEETTETDEAFFVVSFECELMP